MRSPGAPEGADDADPSRRWRRPVYGSGFGAFQAKPWFEIRVLLFLGEVPVVGVLELAHESVA